jgi:phosphatidylglycerol lysyltransferase
MAERQGGWPVFYEVGQAHLDVYIELGLSFVKIGESARVRLESFSLQGKKSASLRHAHNQVSREGFTFEVTEPGQADAIMPRLKAISDEWLASKNTREKGFSLGFFDPEYLKYFPLGIVRKEQEIVAFANIWAGADKEELSVDLMRHQDNAPPGIMDYLFIELMLWGKSQGYKWFSLGMAPLSGFEPRKFSPLWNRLADLIYHHGENFYNFQGVKHYKDKFDPEWQPRFLASSGGILLPTILTNIAALTSRGLKGVIGK